MMVCACGMNGGAVIMCSVLAGKSEGNRRLWWLKRIWQGII